MKNRKKRIELIVELIRNQCIGSQEELAQILSERGYKVTQATLSRDLKMLKTTKVPTDRGTYMYILPDSNSLKDKLLANGQLDMDANYQSGFVSIAFSRNIAVIKTRNGRRTDTPPHRPSRCVADDTCGPRSRRASGGRDPSWAYRSRHPHIH